MSDDDEKPERRRLFNERQEIAARTAAGSPLQFDDIGEAVRFKVTHRLANWIENPYALGKWIERIRDGVGRWNLVDANANNQYGYVIAFMKSAPTPEFFAGVEAGLDTLRAALTTYDREARERFGKHVEELNALFADEFIGYRIVDRTTVQRVDSELLTASVVEEVFRITNSPTFAAANIEYGEAWKSYSRGDFRDAITAASNALESAEKILYRAVTGADADVPAARLAQTLFEQDVLPARLQTFRDQLRTICAQSVTTIRNMPGHGHGSADLVSPEAALALLTLNLAGSLILFLVQAFQRRT